MTDMALIERVAKAIYMRRNGLGCRPWINIEASHRTPYRDDARAAISTIAEALREPTEKMIRDGVAYRLSTKLGGDNRWPEDTAALFSAMLSASPLNGEQQ